MPAAECYQCVVAGATIQWPAGTVYRKCPLCGDRTEWDGQTDALTEQEAAQLVSYHAYAKDRQQAFEKFYAERCETELMAEIGAKWPDPAPVRSQLYKQQG